MPELPEVETVRRGLQSLVAGQVIEWVDVRLPRIIRSPSVDEFVHELQNARIVEVRRRGKYLLLDLGERTLVSHLRMEGHYGVFLASEPLLPHTHVIFHLLGGQELRYQDVRQFGTMDLLLSDHIPHFAPLHLLGPEPLQENFTPTYLRDMFKKRTTSIKATLLDQTIIAGLGNIYVDEILFRAKIHPTQSAQSLSMQALRRIVASTQEVIADAIVHGGSSVKSYVNGFGEPGQYQFSLNVYGRTGQACVVCGSEIVKSRVAGRGTHVCPICQKLPRKARR